MRGRAWITVFIYRGHSVRTLNNTAAGEVRGYRIGDRPKLYKTAGEAVNEIDRIADADQRK